MSRISFSEYYSILILNFGSVFAEFIIEENNYSYHKIFQIYETICTDKHSEFILNLVEL